MSNAAQIAEATAAISGYEEWITVAMMIVAAAMFARLSRVEIGTWRFLRRSRDTSRLGETIKPKKLWYGIMTGSLSLIYMITVLEDVGWLDAGIWPRTVLRVATLTAVYLAARWGDAFYAALQQEAAHPTQGRIMDATDG